MILNRLGNKKQIAGEIQLYFPPHDLYFEPFFGAGGMYFFKPKAKFNYLNDLDEDVYNFWRQIQDNKEDFLYQLKHFPITDKQFKEWGFGKREDTNVLNALRFVVVSNFGLYGKVGSLRSSPSDPKKPIFDLIEKCLKHLDNAFFFNKDFRDFFRKCDYKANKDRGFIYADPPYLETDNNYSEGFTEQDSNDLFDVLQGTGMKWCMSEFDHPFIIEQAKKHGLNVIQLKQRTNIKNKRTEIIILNYNPTVKLF